MQGLGRQGAEQATTGRRGYPGLMTLRTIRLPGWVFPALVVLLTGLPLVELALLVLVGRSVGFLPTLVICASTG